MIRPTNQGKRTMTGKLNSEGVPCGSQSARRLRRRACFLERTSDKSDQSGIYWQFVLGFCRSLRKKKKRLTLANHYRKKREYAYKLVNQQWRQHSKFVI